MRVVCFWCISFFCVSCASTDIVFVTPVIDRASLPAGGFLTGDVFEVVTSLFLVDRGTRGYAKLVSPGGIYPLLDSYHEEASKFPEIVGVVEAGNRLVVVGEFASTFHKLNGFDSAVRIFGKKHPKPVSVRSVSRLVHDIERGYVLTLDERYLRRIAEPGQSTRCCRSR